MRVFTTNTEGVAVFPNAPGGRYAINITHREFASSNRTMVEPFDHAIGNNRDITVRMAERSWPFRNLGWAHILENMGTVSHPNYRISSGNGGVYGWRRIRSDTRGIHFHAGIDLVHRMPNQSRGRRVYSADSGQVMAIFRDPYAPAGYSVVIRHFDPGTRTDFYKRYLHLQALPARANGTLLRVGDIVNRGEHIGRLGNTGTNGFRTGDGSGYHLHFDVHRNFNSSTSAIAEYSIDPQVFFSYGLIGSWDI